MQKILIGCPNSADVFAVELESVLPLVRYLDQLPNNEHDRELDWCENEMAIYYAKSLAGSNFEAWRCVENFAQSYARPHRTLAQWYVFARHLTEHLRCDDE